MQPTSPPKRSRTAPLLAFALLVLLAGVALAVLKPGDLDDSKADVSKPTTTTSKSGGGTTTTAKPSASTTTTSAPKASTTTTGRTSPSVTTNQATTSTTAASGASTTTTRGGTATTSTSAPSSTSPPTTAKPTTTTRGTGTGTGGIDEMPNTGGPSLLLPGLAVLALGLTVRRLAFHR